MVVAADDHGVHRGHAVFDTAAIIEGRIFMLDAHLARFFTSAAAAGLALPFSRAQVRRVVLETAAAARVMDGHVRLWLGAGRGGYALSPAECRRPSLHVAVYTPRPGAGAPGGGMTLEGDPDGLTVCTAKCVAPPDAWAAGIKSTNYLRNALAQAEAEAAGFDLAILADPATGVVTDGVNASVGIITAGGELVIPPWDRALPGVTAQRVLDLLPEVQKQWRGGERERERGMEWWGGGWRARNDSTHPSPAGLPPASSPLSLSLSLSAFARAPGCGKMSQPQTDPILITIFRMRFGRTSNTRP